MQLYYCFVLALCLTSCRAFSVAGAGQSEGRNVQRSLEADETNSLENSFAVATSSNSALTLQEQAKKLRSEAESLKISLEKAKEQKLQRELDNVDKWIDKLLVNTTIDDQTQMLNTVEQVKQLLQDERFSQEQVNKMFDRICETGPPQSRSRCSPLMELLVDAAGKLDEMERDDNPNKRWNGRVERQLRKRLFAMDWGIELEREDD